MHRIEDRVLAVVAAWMTGDDFAAAADYDGVDIGPDPDVAMAISHGHRVVVRLVAHQGLGADPSGGLVAGIERRRRQIGHGGQIAGEPFPDRLGLAAQDVRLPPAALLLEVGVERVPGREPRDRHHEVAAGEADQPLHIALVVPFPGAAVAIAEQVMR